MCAQIARNLAASHRLRPKTSTKRVTALFLRGWAMSNMVRKITYTISIDFFVSAVRVRNRILRKLRFSVLVSVWPEFVVLRPLSVS